MTDSRDVSVALRLSVQRALLGAIGPSVRGVAIGWAGSRILIKAYFDGEVEDEDREAIEAAGTEVISDFPDFDQIEEECVRLDYPVKLDLGNLKHWVYMRREE